jgi:hypothetical protein
MAVGEVTLFPKNRANAGKPKKCFQIKGLLDRPSDTQRSGTTMTARYDR